MFGGYLATTYDDAIENIFKKFTPQRRLFALSSESNTHVAWLFHDYDQLAHNTYADENKTFICDGLPIVGDQKAGYHQLSFSDEFPQGCSFEELLDQIVSDVNALSVAKQGDQIQLRLASNRITCGRIYYTWTQDGAFVFCNDFRPLIVFSEFKINRLAYMSIIKYGIQPDPLTIIEGINTVPLSHYVEIQTPSLSKIVRPFFKLKYLHGDEDLSPLKEILKKSLSFLGSLDPILLLSGGVDSSLLGQYLALNPECNGEAYFLSLGNNDPELEIAKYVSEKIGIPLEICEIGCDDVIPTLYEMVSHYVHPFSDCSTLLTYFLVKKVYNRTKNNKVFVDGTGAGCYAVATMAYPLRRLLFLQPKVLRSIESRLLEGNDQFLQRKSFLPQSLSFFMATTDEFNICQSLLARIPHYDIFSKDLQKNVKLIGQLLDSAITSCVSKESTVDSLTTRWANIQLVHRDRPFEMKTYNVYKNLEVIYPLIWKDALVEQGRLGRLKKKYGINKYPLKKLLEEYFPSEFVYRKKSGFPHIQWLAWLTNPEIVRIFSDVVVKNGMFIEGTIPNRVLDKILYHIKMGRTSAIEELAWSILFTELWLKEQWAKYKENNSRK